MYQLVTNLCEDCELNNFKLSEDVNRVNVQKGLLIQVKKVFLTVTIKQSN